ncbi:MAG: redox-sensitive transcriptional activator SoxR [Gammaproteobacteria bacterium]
MRLSEDLPIATLVRRTGLSVSAIRFYESRGLVTADRNAGGQRRFDKSDIRKLSFVMIAQQLGFSIEQIGQQLTGLPRGRAPTQRDWTRISRQFRQDLDARIAALSTLRDRLDGCIGCGCLSLKKCALYNPADRAASRGAGPRYLLGDSAEKLPASPVRFGLKSQD